MFAVLIAALGAFIWGRWRYDVVALLALLAVTLAGIVPWDEAFLGFGHPAVITVAAVLVVGKALANSGLVGLLTRQVSRVGEGATAQIVALTSLVAVLSAFMNNVGALALLMPVAIQMARKHERPPSIYLMPLAFGSLLGGLSTLIGTPPNIIIATFRGDVAGVPFRMFDFAPAGVGIGLAGLAFVTLVGWRLLPRRDAGSDRDELFRIGEYLTEVRVKEGSSLVGASLRSLDRETKGEIVVVGLIRGESRRPAPSLLERMRAGDVLLVEGSSEALAEFVDDLGLEFAEVRDLGEEELGSDEVELMEAVVTPASSLVGRDATGLAIRMRHGFNILAVARQGTRLKERVGRIRFQAGDVLLVQAPREVLYEALPTLGLLPLAEREIRIGGPRRVFLAVGVFGAAVSLTAIGLVAIQVAFVGAAVLMVMLGLIGLDRAYASVDWPVLVLLGAMIPVGGAMESTGGSELIGELLLGMSEGGVSPALAVGAILVVTMLLSDVINNAAAAVLMAPVALSVAGGLGASPDPFLMATAVGASCAFLTPIGHQSNTLVLGPGGYRFGDFWRLGLPLEIVIVAVGLPLILVVWPT